MTSYPAPLDQQWASDQADLLRKVNTLQVQIAQLTSGPVAVTSSTHPANPYIGQPVYETDTGLTAYWSGTAWTYPPQLITETVLGGSASTVRLPASGSIPQVFTHLRLTICAKSTGTTAAGYDSAGMQFNGITSANYNWNSIFATQGGAPTSAAASTATNMQCAEIWNSHFGTAGGRGIVTIEIPNYSDATTGKVFTSSSAATDGGTAGIQQAYSGALSPGTSTAAITSITVLMGIGSFVAGSVFSLYGY